MTARFYANLARGLPLRGREGANGHINIAAAHARDGGVELAFRACLAVEQRDVVARLQPQHLHMARG